MHLHQHTLNRSEGSAAAVIRELRGANEDYQWYPTTDAMLEVIREDIRAEFGKSYGAPTLVFFRGKYRVASWGDIAERHGAE